MIIFRQFKLLLYIYICSHRFRVYLFFSSQSLKQSIKLISHFKKKNGESNTHRIVDKCRQRVRITASPLGLRQVGFDVRSPSRTHRKCRHSACRCWCKRRRCRGARFPQHRRGFVHSDEFSRLFFFFSLLL